MSWAAVVVIGLVLAMLLFQLFIYLQSKGMVGKRAPDLNGGRELPEEDILIYFYSPGCRPCRSMTALMERLSERYANIVRVDVSRDLDTARRYQVRATPTTILVRRGRVEQVLIGRQKEKRLEELLQRQ